MTNEKDIKTIQKESNVLKEIINNSWNGIGIINLEFSFLYSNIAFSPILGYSRAELKKLNFIDLITDEYKEDFKQIVSKNFEDKYTNNLQLSCKRKDGALVYLNVTVSVMESKRHIILDVNDITQTISEQQIIQKYLVQIQVDLDKNIVMASDAYCRLSGYKESELIGKPYTAKQKNKESIQWEEIKDDNEFSCVILDKTKEKSNFWIESIIKPKHNKYGDILGYTIVMFDITNEMSLEKNKLILQEQITDREEKLNIMTDTMKLIAHEWRQPLNAISLEIQNLIVSHQLGEKLTEEKTMDELSSVTKKIEDLSKIINNFQNIIEITEKKVETNTKSIISKALDYSTIDESAVECKREQTNYFFTYMNDLSKSISHILDNAKEFNDKSDAKDKKILVNTYAKKNNIIFEISNNGGHIPSDIISNIFTPYFSTKDLKNGVGLSLYKCKTIVELHLKGTIEAFNLPDDFVMFKITLPKDSE